jgi:hypothetical protein
MRKGLLISLGLAGLTAASVLQGATAAPLALARASVIASSNGQLFEEIYYYHGRHYPYRYNSRYYAHRVYQNGHWGYY